MKMSREERQVPVQGFLPIQCPFLEAFSELFFTTRMKEGCSKWNYFNQLLCQDWHWAFIQPCHLPVGCECSLRSLAQTLYCELYICGFDFCVTQISTGLFWFQNINMSEGKMEFRHNYWLVWLCLLGSRIILQLELPKCPFIGTSLTIYGFVGSFNVLSSIFH
jgi:hypothetical protein